MKEEIVTVETAKLAKEKGFNFERDHTDYWYEPNFMTYFSRRDDGTYHAIGDYFADTNQNMEQYKHEDLYEAPTQSYLQKWLRDRHSIHIVIIPTETGYFTYKLLDIQMDPENPIERPPYKEVSGEDFHTYEEALEHGLQEALSKLV